MLFAEFIVMIKDFLFTMLAMVSTYIGSFFSMYLFNDVSLGQLFLIISCVGFFMALILKFIRVGGNND